MKINLIFLVFNLFFIFGFSKKEVSLQESKTLKVCSELNFLPLDLKNPDGSPSGFEIDIINEFAKSLGRNLVIFETPFTDSIPNLLLNRCEIIASGLSPTVPRAKMVWFSQSIYTIKEHFVVRTIDIKSNKFKTLQDFDKSGLKIGVRQGNEMETYFRETFKSSKIYSYPKSDTDVFLALLNNKVDAVGLHSSTAQSLMNIHKGKIDIFKTPIPIGSFPIAYAVRKENHEMQNKLNNFLNEFKNSENFKKFYKKYFNSEFL